MPTLPDLIQQSSLDRRLFRRNQPILVAVSGGVDSMVLLHVLHSLAPGQGWKLTVAHLNHRLRGRSSEADERLVRKVVARLKLPLAVSRRDVRSFARVHRLSIEMAARKVRHEFLAAVARSKRIRTVALAHHAGDQLELFFLRLLRGSGSEGLSGMKWRAPSPADPGIDLVRPLLGQPKTALREYAAARKIPFREDATNRSLDIARNRIRHELLPLLRQRYQPAIGRTVLRVMELLGAEAELSGEAALVWLSQATRPAQPGSPADFAHLPLAVQRRCLQLQLAELGIDFDFDLIERLRVRPDTPVSVPARPSRCGGIPAARRRVSSGRSGAARECMIVRGANGLIQMRQRTVQDFSPEHLALDLAGGAGEAAFGGRNFQWAILRGKPRGKPVGAPGRESFDADRVGSPVILRHWLPGDRFQPIGMTAVVKLQNLFVNRKIPRAHRRKLVVATTRQGEVFWVEGLRIAERFKLTQATTRRLDWRWRG